MIENKEHLNNTCLKQPKWHNVHTKLFENPFSHSWVISQDRQFIWPLTYSSMISAETWRIECTHKVFLHTVKCKEWLFFFFLFFLWNSWCMFPRPTVNCRLCFLVVLGCVLAHVLCLLSILKGHLLDTVGSQCLVPWLSLKHVTFLVAHSSIYRCSSIICCYSGYFTAVAEPCLSLHYWVTSHLCCHFILISDHEKIKWIYCRLGQEFK
jgi:hypothetical protein